MGIAAEVFGPIGSEVPGRNGRKPGNDRSASPSARRQDPFDQLDAVQIDALLTGLRELKQRIDRPVAQMAAAFAEARAWRALGHARQEDYARTRLEKTPRWLRLTAALGRALKKFPALDAAFTGQDGGRPLGKTAVVEIATVASETDVAQWIKRARAVSFRQLQKDVRRRRQADALGKPPNPDGDQGSGAGTAPWELTAAERERLAAQDGGEASESTVEVSIECPPEMAVAFDEALDLHRAVSGREASISSFIEALVAEDGAGEEGPAEPSEEIEREARQAGALRDPEQRDPRSRHPAWMDVTDPEKRALRCRRVPAAGGVAPREVSDLVADVFRLERTAAEAAERLAREAEERGDGFHADAHALADQLAAAGRMDAALERMTARLLAALQRKRYWGLNGVAGCLNYEGNAPAWATGVEQYSEERLGLSGSRARQMTRVATRLQTLPVLRDAWLSGRVATDKVLALLPLLKAELIPDARQLAWAEHAQATTVRRLQDEVRELKRRHPGLRRAEPPPPPLPDEDWHASLRRQPGRTSTRLADLADRLCSHPGPSSEVLRMPLPYELGVHLMTAIHRACERAAGETAQQTFSAGDTPDRRPAWMRHRPPPYWYGLLRLLLDYAQTWDPPATPGERRPKHAAIYEREGYRCLAPGCTGRCHLEAHHQKRQSDGGTDDPDNMFTLCTFHHHQGVHGLLMRTSGPAPLETQFTIGRERHALTFRCDKRIPSPPCSP
jgi:hypothetical protein